MVSITFPPISGVLSSCAHQGNSLCIETEPIIGSNVDQNGEFREAGLEAGQIAYDASSLTNVQNSMSELQ